MKPTLLLGLLFLGFILSVKGQAEAYKEDFVRIQNTYEARPKMELSVEYRVYENFSSSTPIDVGTAQVKKSGELIWYKLDFLETITTTEAELTIDHEDKLIWLSAPSSQENEMLMAFALDQLLVASDKLELIQNTNSQKAYRISYASGELEAASFMFNTAELLVKRVTLYYRIPQSLLPNDSEEQKPRMEIDISYLSLSPNFSKSTFSISPFVRLNANGTYEVRKAYESYELISELPQ